MKLSDTDYSLALQLFKEAKPNPQMGLAGARLSHEETWKKRFASKLLLSQTASNFLKGNSSAIFETLFLFENKGINDIIIAVGGFLKDAKTTIDAETIEALGLLRAHFNAPDLSAVKKFEGVRKEGISALEFYSAHYADLQDVMNGRLLFQHDPKLHNAMTAEAHKQGGSISEIVPSYDAVLNARRKAAARLLGLSTSKEEQATAAKFFYTLARR